MKQILNFIPLIFFFIFLSCYDMFVAVKALMISATVVLILLLIIYKKIDKLELFSYLMIIVFGALTLGFHDLDFIKWKVTLINLIFALILLVSQIFFKKNILKTLIGKEITMSPQSWNFLNLIWVIFFMMSAGATLFVTYNMSDDFFGTFKVFILPGATLVMTFISGVYIHKKGLPKDHE